MKQYHPRPHLLYARFRALIRSSHLYYHTILLIVLLFSTLALSQPAFARQIAAHSLHTVRTHHVAADGPTLSQVNMGFDSRFHDGNWVPVQVTLDNSGPDFQGSISVEVPASVLVGAGTTSLYQVPVSLPSGAHKVVTMYVPFTFGTPGNVQSINVDLLNTSSQLVSKQVGSLRTLNISDLFVGILSDQGNGSGFSALSNVDFSSNSTASVITQPLSTATLPTNSVVLRNFDLIVLDNFTTSTLSQQQIDALRNWVDQGGSLLVAGGPEWERTFKSLPAGLVPVVPNGTTTLTGNTTLLPPGTSASNGTQKGNDSITSPLPVSTESAMNGTTVLASGTTPLIVQQHYGQGSVIYLAFDPSLDPINNWSGASALWKSLLFRTVNEQMLMNAQSNGGVTVPIGARNTFTNKPAYLDFNGLLQSLLPNTAPTIVFILVLLLAYILILGPVRMILVRFLKKRDWSWRITLITIVIFSLLSYGLAIKQQGTSIVSDSVSIVQLSGENNVTTTPAHITTFQGIFVPNQGDYSLHIPQGSLVQPNVAINAPNQPSSTTTIAPSSNANDVMMHGVDIWTLRSVVSERDQNLRGGIVSHLSIVNGSLQGTVTNTLPYTLSDAYVLIGNQYLSVGNIASGASASVQLQLDSTFDPTGNQNIANQLNSANGQPSNYSPYNGQRLTNDTQRHLAVLNTLSGGYSGTYTYCVNGTCYQQAIIRPVTPGFSYTARTSMSIASGGNGPYLQYNEYDPLALVGAPVTLIGWADNSSSAQSDILGNVTVNGNAAAGHQEILIQAPLSTTYSGSLNLNGALLHGQLVDAQGTGTLSQGNDAYAMSAGNITYEYTALGLTHLQGATVTISEDANLIRNAPPVTNNITQVDANSLKVQVYNWQKHTWDSFSFTQFSLSINDAQPYVSSDGQILVRLSNSDSSKNIVFNKPLLSLQGSV